MKKLIGALLITTVFSGCIFEDDDLVIIDTTSSPTPSPMTPSTPSPTASAVPTATPGTTSTPAPTAAPSATPTPSATPGGPVVTGSPTPTPTIAPSPTPNATPTPTPTAGSGSAAACFNADLLATGTTIVQTYHSEATDGSNDFTDTREVTGPTTYNGQPAIETDGTTDSTTTTSQGSVMSTSSTQTYSQLDAANSTARQLGVIQSTLASTAFGDFTTTTESTFTPARIDRFDLDVGESYTQTFTVDTTGNVSPGGPIPATSSEQTLVSTYTGRETIAVPAGTFETCRFDRETTVSGQGGSEDSTVWFGVGNGFTIKQVSEGTTSELVEGRINGQLIN